VDLLDVVEARVLGCLLEKELATPQYCPLTLNAVVLACNQSSNRDPVVSFTDAEVAGAIARLREKGAVRIVHSPGQRANKYRQSLGEALGLDEQHRAVLAVLLLRGPQTVGELRIRTERMADFDSLTEVEEVLALLARREEPLARHLDRAPGQKEARWTQLLAEQTESTIPVGATESPRHDRTDEIAELRALVEALTERVETLEGLI
jgi:uncharacterized protein YceH (UPF0502 family)